jgi:NAD-dependent DNA ligase
LALLLLLLLTTLLGGDAADDDGVDGKTETVERGRSPDRDSLFGDSVAADRSGVRVPFSRVVVVVDEGSSRVSSSEKSVEPSSCEMCQSMLTFSNMVFLRCRACSS